MSHTPDPFTTSDERLCDHPGCSTPPTHVCACRICVERLDPTYTIRVCASHRVPVESIHALLLGAAAEWRPITKETRPWD